MGKRALFWMPVEPEATGDALLDAPGGLSVDPGSVPDGPRHARPAGRHALFSDATPATEPERDRAAATATDPVHDRGIFTVACSRCGSVTRVGLVEFVVLHFPWGAWLPGRSFDRWMTCPSCRHRAWTSVTLTR
jgi:hypothetical protein